MTYQDNSTVDERFARELVKMDHYADDIKWWQDRVNAWGSHPHVKDHFGWTKADDQACLEARKGHYAEAQAAAIGWASR